MRGDRLSGDDTVSFWDWLDDLSYDEVHSFVLGLGAIVIAAATGEWAFVLVLAMAAWAFKPYSSKIERVVMREPWYFAAGVTTGGGLAAVLMLLRVLLG